jgi:uracil-DNA glycosylase
MQNPLPNVQEIPLPTLTPTKVPNERPSIEVPYRLAIIGEAPGADEEAYGRPFIGASGRLLDSILNGVGLLRAGCFVGNICQYRPPGNEIKGFGYDHPKVQEGWAELKNQLNEYKPNCILVLGNTPLHFLCGRSGITSWRGSILSSPFGKVVPSIHPAAILRDYKQWPLLRFDALRARKEAESSVLALPVRNLELDLTVDEICARLDNWTPGQNLSFDIEGGLDAFPCCSVSDIPNRGFIIAWSKYDERDQGRVAQSLSRVLYRLDVPKVLQNSLYDRFVLAYGYKMLIRNVREDTMLESWEVYPELPKGLATIASIWTREPYYKFERKTDDPSVLHAYCVRDSCVTLEAAEAMSNALSPNALRHYRFNMDLLSPLLYMEMRGIRYDKALAETELIQVRAALQEASSRLTLRAGYSLTGAKGSISSTKLKKCLFNEKGYPEQKKGRGAAAKLSTDVHSLLNLSKKFPHDAFLSDILLHRKLESILETLEIATDPDQRVRCAYNLVGTETGRLACYTSPTGSGANLQTITKKLRKLFLGDDECYLFQCDLSGADGWTVAAHCLRHGDGTMWEDYNLGLKPARILALMYEKGTEATRCSRDELKDRCKGVDDDGWLYFACKRIQHASNYGVQWATGVQQIAHDSYKMTGKPVWLNRQTFETLQRLYFVRYSGIYQWQNWCGAQVEDGKNLTSASGHTRIFFGRRKSYNPKTRSVTYDHETWKEFLADEPQENTTYSTNLAMHRLWHDPANRYTGTDGKTHLVIEPLHQVHDALIGQFPKVQTDKAVVAIRSYFANTIRVAGVEFVIPFEGKYGRSWGELTEGTI